jgi:hypothetical protein
MSGARSVSSPSPCSCTRASRTNGVDAAVGTAPLAKGSSGTRRGRLRGSRPHPAGIIDPRRVDRARRRSGRLDGPPQRGIVSVRWVLMGRRHSPAVRVLIMAERGLRIASLSALRNGAKPVPGKDLVRCRRVLLLCQQCRSIEVPVPRTNGTTTPSARRMDVDRPRSVRGAQRRPRAGRSFRGHRRRIEVRKRSMADHRGRAPRAGRRPARPGARGSPERSGSCCNASQSVCASLYLRRSRSGDPPSAR